MKRMIAIVLVILAMTMVLAGCSGTQSDTGMTNGSTGASSNEAGMGNTTGSSSGTNANGSSSGTNANGSYGTDGMTTVPDAGNGTPSSNENGIIDEEPPAVRDDNVIEEFGNDVQDAVDDAGNAVQDAVQGRSSRSGTGMTGGR